MICYADPVQIPATSEEQTIKILSSGEIEFEDVEPVSRRKKRSLAYSQSSGFDVVDHGISPRERPRRKSIETLVVADRDMIRNHEHDRRDVTTYILTIMNMVSFMMHDIVRHMIDYDRRCLHCFRIVPWTVKSTWFCQVSS